jgi:hypothetical protein
MATSIAPELQVPNISSHPSRLRSVGALMAALVVVAGLSHATDEVLRFVGVFPGAEAVMAPALYALALLYRTSFGVLGGVVVAWLAPHAPRRHAAILGVVGVVLSLLGVLAALAGIPGPLWYPIGLVVTAFPSAWLGGRLAYR